MTAAVVFDDVLAGDNQWEWPDPLSCAVDEGVFLCVRTTPARSESFFRLCLGLRAPERGTVEVLGASPGSLGRRDVQIFRRQLGCGLRPDGLISNLTLRQNLTVPLVYSGFASMSEAEARTDMLLRECGLALYADERPAELPPDVRQSAVVARALAPAPELLLLDDPMASVKSREMEDLLRLCRREARTTIVAVHRRSEVLYEFADGVAFWDDHGFRMADA